MKKLVIAVGVVMLISTGVIADTAPLLTGKALLAPERRDDSMSLLLVAGGVVVGGVTLVTGETNN